jgi:predicted nucleotide-binding protein
MNLGELGDLAGAAGDLTGALCAPWDGEPEDDPVQVKICDLVKLFYNPFSRTLTDDHLRVLVHLEGCRLCQSSNLITHVHDITSADPSIQEMVREEFETRIDLLTSHGRISPAANNKVCISHLGKGVIRVFRQAGQLPPERPARREKAFIGSSTQGLPVARTLQSLLRNELRCVVWNQGTVFGIGDATVEALEKAVHDFDFGIFVFTPDDILVKKGVEQPVARDNVLFELGLFIGKLTRKRAFVVNPAKRAISLPTDLLGMTTATYDPSELPTPLDDADEESLAIALGPVANDILNAVRRVRRESQIPECA